MGTQQMDDEIEIDLLELLLEMKKRIGVLILCLMIGAVAGLGATQLLITPMYSSTATMLVLSKDSTQISIADLQVGTQLTADYTVLVTSRPVLEKVIKKLDLDMEPAQLAKMITINNPKETRILEMKAESDDPKLASSIVNTLAEEASTYIGNIMEATPPKIIETGLVAKHPFSPSVPKNTLIGAVIGLLLCAGVITLRVVMDDTIKTEEDIEKYLGIPTLSVVPDRRDFINKSKGVRRAEARQRKNVRAKARRAQIQNRKNRKVK